MKSFQKNNRLSDVMQSKTSLVILGIIILVFAYSMFSFLNKMIETSKNKKIVQDKIAELQKSKEKLNLDINKLKTEKGVEENIREKFGLAKDGENMILVVDDQTNKQTEQKAEAVSFWSFFKNLFK